MTNPAAGQAFCASWIATSTWSPPPGIVELRQITCGRWRLADAASAAGGTSAPSMATS